MEGVNATHHASPKVFFTILEGISTILNGMFTSCKRHVYVV